jgi:hypothetical protein
MSKRASRSKNRGSLLRQQSSTDSLQEKKGNTSNSNADTTATMNGVMLEHRRKHASFDSSSPSSQAASLMGNSNFSLDDEVPKLGEEEEGPSKGFFELSKKDQSNFLLLVLLYFLQGIPMGLAHGSVPFLLKHNVSYAAIGVFSLAAYCGCRVVAQGGTEEELDSPYTDHLRLLDDMVGQKHQSHDEGGGRDGQWSLDLYLVVVCARVPVCHTGHCCRW